MELSTIVEILEKHTKGITSLTKEVERMLEVVNSFGPGVYDMKVEYTTVKNSTPHKIAIHQNYLGLKCRSDKERKDLFLRKSGSFIEIGIRVWDFMNYKIDGYLYLEIENYVLITDIKQGIRFSVNTEWLKEDINAHLESELEENNY